MTSKRIERRERELLDRLGRAIGKLDAGDKSSRGEVSLARWELRQFYRSIGMHP